MEEKIISLYQKGFSYREIKEVLGCSLSTISYHCGDMQKEKQREKQRERNRNQCPILKKINKFKEDKSKNPSQKKKGKDNTKNKIKGGVNKVFNSKRNQFSRVGSKKERQLSGDKREYMFTNAELKDKIINDPYCYLTGEQLELEDSQHWSLDHIVPKSRGGTNELTNAGQTLKIVNQMKSDMTVDELHEMCKKILNHAGYRVEKLTENTAKKTLGLT